MRTWTDKEVAIYKSHTENQLREIVKDRDEAIEFLKEQYRLACEGSRLLAQEARDAGCPQCRAARAGCPKCNSLMEDPVAGD